MAAIVDGCKISKATCVDNAKLLFKAIDGKEGGWKHGYCTDIASDPLMLIWTYCCPCVVAGAVTSKNGGNACVSCLCYCCCPCCALCAHRMVDRKKLRESVGGKGDVITDYYLSGLCPTCALMQEAKQQGYKGIVKFEPPSQEQMKARPTEGV